MMAKKITRARVKTTESLIESMGADPIDSMIALGIIVSPSMCAVVQKLYTTST